MDLPTISTRHRPKSTTSPIKQDAGRRRLSKFLSTQREPISSDFLQQHDEYLQYSHSVTNMRASPNRSNKSQSLSVPSTPSSVASSQNTSMSQRSHSVIKDDNDLPKPKPSRYYMDSTNTVHLRGPPTPTKNPKPTTAQLQSRKEYNEIEQTKMYQENAHTFANNDTSLTLAGHLFLQSNYKLKTDPLTWIEQYCILDPATKLLSFHDHKSSAKCNLALSLSNSRVIYGGEVPRLISSLNGGKKKMAKLHSVEITVRLQHKGINKKYYVATADMSLTTSWIQDMLKIVHKGVVSKTKEETASRREEERAKSERAANLIKCIQGKHKLNRQKEYERQLKMERIAKNKRLQEELERRRVKTPQWAKDFSVDALIEELTKEREEKLQKALEAEEHMKQNMTPQELESHEETKVEHCIVDAAKKHTHKQQFLSNHDSTSPKAKPGTNDTPKKHRPNNQLANKMPSIMIDALTQSYEETKLLLYSEAAATYIQRLFRGRRQRVLFLKQLNIRKYQQVALKACRLRRDYLAATLIQQWYRNRKYFQNVICPIEDLYASIQENTVVIPLLKSWLSIAPPEIDKETLADTVPKAMHKYHTVDSIGMVLHNNCKRLIELIRPRYEGKEHLYATSQCFMCGRPKKACTRMIKSLPRSVRKSSLVKKIDDLRFDLIDDEDRILQITRDHAMLVNIAEASLIAVACREVSNNLREIWKIDGRPIEPENLPSMLMSIESQCWSKVAQFHRMRKFCKESFAQDAAEMAVNVCEMQFGGWTDSTGLHLFSDHPALCISRLHLAHTILCGKSGRRQLKRAMDICKVAQSALTAWSGAKKARETRLKLLTMKNWKNFCHFMDMWRYFSRKMRFYNLRVKSLRLNAIKKNSDLMIKKRNEKFQKGALAKFQIFALKKVNERELVLTAKDHYFQMFVRQVYLSWVYYTRYRISCEERHDAVVKLSNKLCEQQYYRFIKTLWWQKEREKRCMEFGLFYMTRYYFRMFVAGAIISKKEQLASIVIQRYSRRFVVINRQLHDDLRTHKFTVFSRGRIGLYLQDSIIKLKHKIDFRGEQLKISASFVCDAIKRPMSHHKRSMFLSTPIATMMKDELLQPLKARLLRFAFPIKPSVPYLKMLIADETGNSINNPLDCSLVSKKIMKDAVEGCCDHMNVVVSSKVHKKRTCVGRITYTNLLSWMETNLPKSPAGYYPSMNRLVTHYLSNTHTSTLKTYLFDPAESTVITNLTATQRKRDLNRMMEKFHVATRSKKLQSSLITGAVATYVPWIISCALVNVSSTIDTTYKPEVENVYEQVIVNSGFASIRIFSLSVDNSVRRENALLLVTTRCIDHVIEASSYINSGLIGDLAKREFEYLYPEMRKVCDNLDAFKGNPIRKVRNVETNAVRFLYPQVVKIELDSIQLIAQEVRKAIFLQIKHVKKLNALRKLLSARKVILRKMIDASRAWKEEVLRQIFQHIEVCERYNKQRKRSEELSVAALSVRKINCGTYKKWKRQLIMWSDRLKGEQFHFYVSCERLRRRLVFESEAIMKENEFIDKTEAQVKVIVANAAETMSRTQSRLSIMWSEREALVVKAQKYFDGLRMQNALMKGDKEGADRHARRTAVKMKKEKKLIRHCHYYYNKILERRAKVEKKTLTNEQRWERLEDFMVHVNDEAKHLMQLVQNRKPPGKYALSVSKVHQIELIVEKLRSAVVHREIKESLNKFKPIATRVKAAETTMKKQLKNGSQELKEIKLFVEVLEDAENRVKRMELNIKNEEEALKLSCGDPSTASGGRGGGILQNILTPKQREVLQVKERTKEAAQAMIRNNDLALRRIAQVGKFGRTSRAKEERAALFVQAVWNYRKMKKIHVEIRRIKLIELTQANYRRRHAIKVINAKRIQRWLRWKKDVAIQMVKVNTQLRARRREVAAKNKVGAKVKKKFDKIWDVANERYLYKHKYLPGVVFDQKPQVLGNDDVLTPRSKRRQNWAMATGGREELNEPEAAGVIIKFMKLTFFTDAGGFRISQQWYGSRFKKKRPTEAVVIIQKIVRTQVERWGGGKRFRERDSHTMKHVQRRFQDEKKKKVKVTNSKVKMGSVPQHLQAGFSKSKAPERVGINVTQVYCGSCWRSGERERLATEKKMALRKAAYDKKKEERRARRGGGRGGLGVGESYSFAAFFSNAIKSKEEMDATRAQEGGEANGVDHENLGSERACSVLVIGDFFNHLDTFSSANTLSKEAEAEEREAAYQKNLEFEREKRRLIEADNPNGKEMSGKGERKSILKIGKQREVTPRRNRGGDSTRRTVQFNRDKDKDVDMDVDNANEKQNFLRKDGDGEDNDNIESDEDLDFLAGKLADDAFSKLEF